MTTFLKDFDPENKDLQHKIIRGARARFFINTAFWRDDVKPYFLRLIQELDGGNRWTPRDQKLDSVAMGVAHNSGAAGIVEEITKEFDIWAQQAAEARKTVKKKKNRRKEKRR